MAPLATSGRLQLHYRSTGSGPAVLLVMGLGMTADAWWRTVPVLARSFRVLTLDNRGVGHSDATTLPYTVASMADDAVAVLDATDAERAHVYGISLGGMVAQEIALRHPDRVQALVLGATTPGGTPAVPGDENALSLFSRAAVLTAEESAWASVPYLYSESTRRRHAQRIAADLERRAEATAGPLAQLQQLTAAFTHNAAGRIDSITAPTLVVHGAEDRIVPVDNARLLAETIPGAELRIWDRAGHLYVTDEPRADHQVAHFLLRHSPRLHGLAGLLPRARNRIRLLGAAAHSAPAASSI